MNSSTTNDGENNLPNSAVNIKFSSTIAQRAEEQVPICSICHVEFDPTNFAVLDCSHAFHSECIQHWLTIQQKCPYCNRENVNAHHIVIERRNQEQDATGNEGNMKFWSVFASSDEALRLALIAYDRELHASTKDPFEGAALEATFQKIRALTQSQQYQDKQNRQRRLERIKRIVRLFGISALIAALMALFFYFSWFYWPLIEPPYRSMAIMLTHYYIINPFVIPKLADMMVNSRLVRYAIFSVLAVILIYFCWLLIDRIFDIHLFIL